MLTQEQIQNLKPGDKLLVEAYFVQEGCSYIKCALSPTYAFDTTTFGIHPYALSIPSEIVNRQSSTVNKHDPTRLFREGDIVRPVEKEGRTYFDAPPLGEKCLVIEGESETGIVCVEYRYAEDEKPAIHEIPFHFLELVTPVEELEPYKLIDSPNTYNIVRDRAMVMTIHKKSHPNAKAAAEAERDRLNAEWRKEQK